MAGKMTGLGDALYVNGVDLTGDINSIGVIGGGPAAINMTNIRQLAFDRKGGLRDGRLEVANYLNSDAGSAHVTFAGADDVADIQTVCLTEVLGAPAASLVTKQANYSASRPADGSILFNASGLASGGYGLDWGVQHTAGTRTDTAATNGTGVDGLAATAFGLQAFLHVMAFTGTSATVKIQQSSDNGGADAFTDVTGGSFAVVSSAPQAQRIETTRALAVERYLRVVTTGTFSNLAFLVVISKNPTEVLFNV